MSENRQEESSQRSFLPHIYATDALYTIYHTIYLPCQTLLRYRSSMGNSIDCFTVCGDKREEERRYDADTVGCCSLCSLLSFSASSCYSTKVCLIHKGPNAAAGSVSRYPDSFRCRIISHDFQHQAGCLEEICSHLHFCRISRLC